MRETVWNDINSLDYPIETRREFIILVQAAEQDGLNETDIDYGGVCGYCIPNTTKNKDWQFMSLSDEYKQWLNEFVEFNSKKYPLYLNSDDKGDHDSNISIPHLDTYEILSVTYKLKDNVIISFEEEFTHEDFFNLFFIITQNF